MAAEVSCAAVRVLDRVLGQGASLDAVLGPELARLPERQRGLCAQLCYGALRWHARLAALLEQLLATPLRKRDRDVQLLLLCALFELEYLSSAAYGVVDRSVEAARALGKPWAARLVNAVLRRFQREREALLARVDAEDTARLAYPGWWLASWREDWPESWLEVAEAGNRRAPMTLRVNRRRVSRESYLERLRDDGIGASAHPLAPDAVVLDAPVAIERLAGFAAGEVSVQDAAAQLAAPLLDLAPGQRLLDACAAPGGKTAHALEIQPGLREVVALDVDAERAGRIAETLTRLGLRGEAQVRVADAGEPASWWDGQAFDRILLDAPCSGSGVIRRHPDIKHLRRASDVSAMARRQSVLLDALWPALARGGMLLYATCSVNRMENDTLITAFLGRTADACEQPLPGDWGRACRHGRQLLPGTLGMDGFYYARLLKRA